MAEKYKKKASDKKLKNSQFSFNLPKELLAEIKSRLEEAKNKENAASKKMEELLEKERFIDTTHKDLEEEKTKFRKEIQEQMVILQKRFENDKKLSESEIARLQHELEENQTHCDALRMDRNKTLEEYQNKKVKLENKLYDEETAYQKKFNILTEKMRILNEEEKELLKRKQKEKQYNKKKEKLAKQATNEQIKRIKEIEAALKDGENKKRKYKAQLDKQYKAKKQKLQKEFDEKSEYHIRRFDEAKEDELQLERKRESLKIKEKSLALETQRKVDEQIKVRQSELDKRDEELVKLQKELTEQEETLNTQKLKFLKTVKAQKGGDFVVSQLKKLAQEEEDILQNKKKFLKKLKKLHVPNEEIVQKKIQIYKKQKDEAIAKLDEERKMLKTEHEKLKRKEKTLIRRETQELRRLNEEYEELRDSLEIEHIEESSELDEMRDRVSEEEQKLINRHQQIQQNELETSTRIKEQLDLAIPEFEEVQEIKETLFLKQLEADEFLGDFHKTYSNRLDLQASEYENFKKTLENLKTEAQNINQSLKEKGETRQKISAVTENKISKRLKDRETIMDALEKELHEKAEEYQKYIIELQNTKKEVFSKDQARQNEYHENLTNYEGRLSNLGKAFEDLSQTFQEEKASGSIEVINDSDNSQKYKTRITKDGDVAKLEWPSAIRYKLCPETMDIDTSMLKDYLEGAAENWDEWIDVPPGEYWMGNKQSKESAPYKQVKIKKPIMIAKYPLTNSQFYQFALDSHYLTDAEKTVNGIVYHDGKKTQMDASGKVINHSYSNPSLNPNESATWFRPNGKQESCFEKHNHPVTQVTWNDAMAYCRWKSKELGKTVRLPWENEWEYVAKNFGHLPPEEFYWNESEAKGYCNIEETGIGDTTPVNFFPEQEMGMQDLFGNVYEWVIDSCDNKSPVSKRSNFEYKMVRGGSYITNYQQIAPWRRLPFANNYCTSFLGFRVVIEEN